MTTTEPNVHLKLVEPNIDTTEIHIRPPKDEREIERLQRIFPMLPMDKNMTYRNLMIDEEGLIYATPKHIVRDIFNRILTRMEQVGIIQRGQKIKVIDATGGIGGDTINMGQQPRIETIETTELDLSRVSALKHNVDVYDLDNKVTIHHKNFLEWIEQPEQQEKIKQLTYVLYADLPWGGVDYKSMEVVDDIFMIEPTEQRRIHLRDIIRRSLSTTSFMVLKVPKNYNEPAMRQLATELGFHLDIHVLDTMTYYFLYHTPEGKTIADEDDGEGPFQTQKQRKRQDQHQTRQTGIYTPMMITQKAFLSILNVGTNIKQTLETYISQHIEGKCIAEGYVRPSSTRIISYSSGELKEDKVVFDVVFECLVCSPVEGQHIYCVVKNITETAGIRAEIDEIPSPLVIYVARDHHYTNQQFSKVKQGEKIKVRVIGQRFELNDRYISVIAELIEDKREKYMQQRKQSQQGQQGQPQPRKKLVIKS
jgi:hypothetical protein